MRRIEVKIRQICWAFSRIFKPTNYDLVIYKGKKYNIKTSLTGENVWNLFEEGKGKPYFWRISGNDFKIVHSIKRAVIVFKENIQFQENSWGLIDCQNKLGTRLTYITSDNIWFSESF